MKAMILAAGLGTRLRPLTNDRPKALVEINGVSLLEITIRRLKKYGFTNIIVNVHHFADQIITFLQSKNHFDINIVISDETEEVLETGGGLLKARSFFDHQPFLLCNVDVVTSLDLGHFYQSHLHRNALVTLATRQRSTSRYLIFDNEDLLHGWMNVKAGVVKMSRPKKGELFLQAFSGIQVISPELFDYMPAGGKFSIIDVYLKAAEAHSIFAFPHDGDIWLDVGKPDSLKVAASVLANIELD